MTRARLLELQQLAQNATPGPWQVDDHSEQGSTEQHFAIEATTVYATEEWRKQYLFSVVETSADRDYNTPEGGICKEADAHYIAAFSPDVTAELLRLALIGKRLEDQSAEMADILFRKPENEAIVTAASEIVEDFSALSGKGLSIEALREALDRIEDEMEVRPGEMTRRGTIDNGIDTAEVLRVIEMARSKLTKLEAK